MGDYTPGSLLSRERNRFIRRWRVGGARQGHGDCVTQFEADPTSSREPATSMSNTIDTSALLTQLRSMAREAGVPAATTPTAGVGVASPFDRATGVAGAREGTETATGDSDVVFTDLLRGSLESVNARSQESRRLTKAFESGRPGVELVDVMIAAQKARVSFEALTQVRNKMVSAYKDIMSTPL